MERKRKRFFLLSYRSICGFCENEILFMKKRGAPVLLILQFILKAVLLLDGVSNRICLSTKGMMFFFFSFFSGDVNETCVYEGKRKRWFWKIRE